jgi:hypothetical protein
MVELPPKYYLDYFAQVLGFVEEHYGFALGPAEREWLADFWALPEDARCLYVRMANRRPAFFQPAALAYPEITDPANAWPALVQAGFAVPLGQLPPPEGLSAAKYELLADLAKAELLAVYLRLGPDPAAKRWKKAELAQQLATFPAPALWPAVASALPALVQKGRMDTLEFFQFLFFGNLDPGNMAQFVVRDVGHARFVEVDAQKLAARVGSREEAVAQYRALRAYRDFKRLRDAEVPIGDIFAWSEQLRASGHPLTDKHHLRLGELLERAGHWADALRAYAPTRLPPARERQVRLWHKLGQPENAATLARELLAAPQNADEYFFAQDFLQKLAGGKRRKSTTAYLRAADEIVVGAQHQAYVEGGAIAYLRAQGYQAVHSENFVWNCLFGLLLWPIVFDQDQAALHHPLERGPSDLYQPGFYEKRQARLEAWLGDLADAPAALALAEQMFHTHFGTANPLVGWHTAVLEWVRLYLGRLPWPQVRAVLHQMAQNLRENTRGFPDLFVWNAEDCYFAEIKSPNDHLSAQQLFWLNFFEKIGLKAKVLKVAWDKPDLLT